MALAALMFTGCDRDLGFETLTITEPALEVLVEGEAADGQYPKIAGASVTVLNSAGQELATATTEASGKVQFTQAQLKEKGTFTVRAQKDGASAEVTTPYILLNDGVTLVIVTLQTLEL